MTENATYSDMRILSTTHREFLPGRPTETHRFVITYYPENDKDVLRTLVEMAGNPDLPFDWFDASILSYRMEQQIVADANL
jgi:hypothetical protein